MRIIRLHASLPRRALQEAVPAKLVDLFIIHTCLPNLPDVGSKRCHKRASLESGTLGDPNPLPNAGRLGLCLHSPVRLRGAAESRIGVGAHPCGASDDSRRVRGLPAHNWSWRSLLSIGANSTVAPFRRCAEYDSNRAAMKDEIEQLQGTWNVT